MSTEQEKQAEFEARMRDSMAKIMQDAIMAMTQAATAAAASVIATAPETVAAQPVQPRGCDETANKLEEFSGSGGLYASEWIRRFELAKDVGQWTEEQTKVILMVKMTGGSRYWHLNHGVKCATYADWKTAFVVAYSSKQKKSALLDELQRCYQQKGEPVEEYARRKEAIGMQLDLTFEDIKDQILRGLRPEYASFAHDMNSRSHVDVSSLVYDLEEAVVLQQHINRSRESGGQSSSSMVDCRSGAMSIRPKCFSCGLSGHRRVNCPTRFSAAPMAADYRQPQQQQRPTQQQSSSLGLPRSQQPPQQQYMPPWRQQLGAGGAVQQQHSAYIPQQQQVNRGAGGGGSSTLVSKQGCFRCGLLGHIARNCNTVNQTVINNDVKSERGVKFVTVNEVEWRALVDTEAGVTVIAQRAVEQMNIDIEPTTLPIVHGIGGPCIPIGECTVTVGVDGLTHKDVRIVVLPDSGLPGEAMLLGKNVLDRKELVTVYHDGTALILKADAYPEIAKLFPVSEPKVNLVAIDDCILPPRSVSMVKVEGTTKESQIVLVEEDQCGVGVLCEVNDCTVVPVINYGNGEVILSKGAIVKRGREISSTDIFKLKPSTGVINESESEREVPSVMCIKKENSEEKEITLGDLNFGDNVPHGVRVKLLALTNKYRNVVTTSMMNLGQTPLAEFEIEEVTGSHPVASKPYRMSNMEREALRKLIKEMRDANMIRPSNSSYASPVLLVKKKNGDFRLVIDYRKLNAQTVRINYPMPLIDDVIDAVGGKRLYTTMDLAFGFFQIPMAAGSAEKAAFITSEGLFQPNVMMMGLTNGPATFQQVMTRIKETVGNNIAFPFLDDVITASDRYDDQLENIEKIFSALSDAKLTVKLQKCNFFMESVEFLGFKLSQAGVQPGSKKLRAIAEFPKPKNVLEIRRFLGLSGFFRRFVKGYANKAAPLSDMLKKGAQFEWSLQCDKAFEELSNALMNSPVLVNFVPDRPTQIHCDASKEGIGCLLLQQDEGVWKLVYAISRKLSSSERNYHSTKLEQLAVVWAMQRLRHYLYGHPFTVVTDCTAVMALKSKAGTPQLARWLDQLSEFDFKVKHRPGTSMQHADALSRGAVEEPPEDNNDGSDEQAVFVHRVTIEAKVGMAQAGDSQIANIVSILKKKKQERTSKEDSIVQNFVVINNVLYRECEVNQEEKLLKKKLFVVPQYMRKYVCVITHDRAGHFGVDKTLRLIRERYWFLKMKTYVKQHVRACIECIFNKDFTGRKQGFCHPIPPERRPFQKLFVDYLGPLPKSNGKEHVIVAVDGFSKFILLEGVKSASSACAIKFLQKVFLRFGRPDSLVSDRGTAFTSSSFKQFIQQRAVRHILISSQFPQSNGQCERYMKEIARLLRTCCMQQDKKDWAAKLSMVEHHINRVPAKSTGKAPFEVLHGYLPPLDNFSSVIDQQQEEIWRPAEDVQAQIRFAIAKAQEEYARHYDKKRLPHSVRYEVGDVVVVRRLPVHTGEPTKLQPRFRGPMVITAVMPKNVYRIADLMNEKGYAVTAPCAQLRLYKVAREEGEVIEGPLDYDPDNDESNWIEGYLDPLVMESPAEEIDDEADAVATLAADVDLSETTVVTDNNPVRPSSGISDIQNTETQSTGNDGELLVVDSNTPGEAGAALCMPASTGDGSVKAKYSGGCGTAALSKRSGDRRSGTGGEASSSSNPATERHPRSSTSMRDNDGQSSSMPGDRGRRSNGSSSRRKSGNTRILGSDERRSSRHRQPPRHLNYYDW